MCLDVLDKALFVVCLDDANPQTASEMCSNMLCGTYKLDKGVQVGTCTNRYYDKVSSRGSSCRLKLEVRADDTINLAPNHRRRQRSCRGQL